MSGRSRRAELHAYRFWFTPDRPSGQDSVLGVIELQVAGGRRVAVFVEAGWLRLSQAADFDLAVLEGFTLGDNPAVLPVTLTGWVEDWSGAQAAEVTAWAIEIERVGWEVWRKRKAAEFVR